jgi:hypothetical protein
MYEVEKLIFKCVKFLTSFELHNVHLLYIIENSFKSSVQVKKFLFSNLKDILLVFNYYISRDLKF